MCVIVLVTDLTAGVRKLGGKTWCIWSTNNLGPLLSMFRPGPRSTLRWTLNPGRLRAICTVCCCSSKTSSTYAYIYIFEENSVFMYIFCLITLVGCYQIWPTLFRSVYPTYRILYHRAMLFFSPATVLLELCFYVQIEFGNWPWFLTSFAGVV